MPQFLVPSIGDLKTGERLRLPTDEARHARDILRMKKGEGLELTDGEGTRFHASIDEISRKDVFVVVLKRAPPVETGTMLKVAQALLKGERLEFVIQKAVELGAASFLPFSSSRTVVRFKKDEKLPRWQRIADEALKQCGGVTRMNVAPPSSFEKLIENEAADLKILFWEEEGEGIRKLCSSGRTRLKGSQTILMMIGPEGGFSREEADAAKKAGFIPVSLGKRILRAETAAVAAMTLIQYELGNL